MSNKLSEQQFAQAVDACLPRLVAIARRLANEEDLASDALQNALLKASKSWQRFQGRSHVETWLIRILIHCVRDAIRDSRHRRDQVVQTDPNDLSQLLASVADPQRGPTEMASDNETEQLVREAVMDLPHRQREVFSLIVWQGMTANQVAEIIGTNPPNVHANLHAARQRLRNSLQSVLDNQAGE
ncbi:RNA polymerase sigma factor [Roseiconus sp. JC912]